MTPERIASIEAEMDAAGLRQVYDYLIELGNSPNMAAMLASQKAPGTWTTDADFSKRENERMRSQSESHTEEINKIARDAGINTAGKTYNGQLGKYNDPLAWVSSKDDVKTAAVKKGMDIDGMVKVNAYRPNTKKGPRLAKDIVDRLEKIERKKDRKLDLSCSKSDNARKELRNKIVDRHGRKKGK